MEARDKFLALKEFLGFVMENSHSDFYSHKYERADFDPRRDFKSMDDIKKGLSGSRSSSNSNKEKLAG